MKQNAKTKGMKGQSSIVDALLFLLICSSASVLIFYTAGLYSENTVKQVGITYNFEFARTALIAMHYAQDAANNFLWIELEQKLATSPTDIEAYLTAGNGAIAIEPIFDSSPSTNTILEITGNVNNFFFYKQAGGTLTYSNTEPELSNKTVFSSNVILEDNSGETWQVTLKLAY